MYRFLSMSLAILLLGMLPASALAQSEIINTIAGNGNYGFLASSGSAVSMPLANPRGVSVDGLGNMYFADTQNNCVRKVLPSGWSITMAGKGNPGSGGDGGLATLAYLNSPTSTAIDALGNLYIAEQDSHRIRKVNSAGIISRVVGISTPGFSGDGGNATSAMLNTPKGIAVDLAGNLYIADSGNNRIRKVTPDGKISTVAGNGNSDYSGDGGPATSASLYMPEGVSVDADGNLYIADYANNCIRMVNSDGIISTIAGTGIYGFSGDGGAATAAQLDSPESVAIDAAGNLFIADLGNNRIRKVDLHGIISTVVGTDSTGFGGDGGLASAAMVYHPIDLAVDEDGSVYFSDLGNLRIRKIEHIGGAKTYFPQIAIGGGYTTYFTITNTGSTSASASLNFSDGNGNPLEINAVVTDANGTTNLDAASSLPVDVPSGGVAFITVTTTDPEGSIKTGWASLIATGGALTSVASYEYVADGVIQTRVAVSEATPNQFVTIPVDNDTTQRKQLAYAIVNPSGMTINIKLAFVNAKGVVVNDTKTIQLGPRRYQAGYLDQILNCSNFKGSVVFRGQNTATFVIISLLDKEGIFTSIPIASGKAPSIPN